MVGGSRPRAHSVVQLKKLVVAASLASVLLLLVSMASAPLQVTAQEGTAAAGPKDVILATTTSTQDSGLLDVLIPMFEEQTGYNVKPIAVGSGAALKLGEEGEADVLLVHSPAAEREFMDAGFGVNRRLVMYNDFVIVGPASDPAGIKGMDSALDAMRAIANAQATFVSRGDESGTHKLELSLWQQAGITLEGSWYQESGTGMGDTLNIANEREAYTISDRGTFLAVGGRLDLSILVEGDKALLNIYHVIQVNPDRHDTVNVPGAEAFIAFMLAPETQKVIGEFGVDKFGQPLFTPCAADSCGVEAGPTASPVASPAP